MAQTVDEERRRPVHAASNAAQEVIVDPIGVDVLGELFAEQVEVKVEHPSVGVEIVVRQASLVLVQVVVHLPEPPLRRRPRPPPPLARHADARS